MECVFCLGGKPGIDSFRWGNRSVSRFWLRLCGGVDDWGGGSIFAYPALAYGGQIALDGRVTHGFVVHCTPRHSDHLEIVDHVTGLNFHLTDLIYTECSDNPEIEPNPPDAAFDTFYGEGVGRCKLPSGHWEPCSISFEFTDGGERGGCLRDTAYIAISYGSGNLFVIGGDVDCGNHQAHDGF